MSVITLNLTNLSTDFLATLAEHVDSDQKQVVINEIQSRVVSFSISPVEEVEVEEEVETVVEPKEDPYKALDQFLAAWKDSALEYYCNLKETKQKLMRGNDREAYEDFLCGTPNSHLDFIQYENRKSMSEKLDKEVEYRKAQFLFKIEKKGGKIKEVNYLTFGCEGSINGMFNCENGNVVVRSILAGGYNIQCLHYRVLVKLSK